MQAHDLLNEVEALKQHGVNLAAHHENSYVFLGEHAPVYEKPWESPATILQDLGLAKAERCAAADGWNNEDFLFEVREGIAYCTLNRPAANNSMNLGIQAGLHDSSLILQSRPEVRIAILTGNGRMFCAGGDPKSFQEAQAREGVIPQPNAGDQAAEAAVVNPMGPDIAGCAHDLICNPYLAAGGPLARDLMQWASLPQFTICCLNGSAMGGGVGLLCACDLVVAVKTAHITLSEVKLGVIPAAISPHVIRSVGHAHAKRLFMCAENLNMQSAVEVGLVQRVVNDTSEFPKVIKELAQKIQAVEPFALANSKEAVLSTVNKHVSEDLMNRAVAAYVKVRKGEACEAGMKALSIKKKPDFMNKAIDVKEEHGEYIPEGPPPQVTLTRQQAVAMEDEFVRLYGTEEFQARLRKAFEAAGSDTIKQGRARQEACLEVQKPVLRKYGFEASKRGVAMSVQAFSPFSTDQDIGERNALLAWLVNPITQALSPRPTLSNP